MNWTLQVDNKNETFKNKQKDLFSELDKVRTALPNERYVEHNENPNRNVNKRCTMKTYKGRKSIFKRPEAPLRKCLPLRKKPDYQLNPQKWTKYSLSDVAPEDMTEKANKNAALTFLKELEERREEERQSNERISFKNSAMITTKQKEEEQKTVFQNSKLIMPEYVIGQKKNKEKKNFKRETTKKNELKLSHLIEDEEENNT